jgi:hypothetical protein
MRVHYFRNAEVIVSSRELYKTLMNSLINVRLFLLNLTVLEGWFSLKFKTQHIIHMSKTSILHVLK